MPPHRLQRAGKKRVVSRLCQGVFKLTVECKKGLEIIVDFGQCPGQPGQQGPLRRVRPLRRFHHDETLKHTLGLQRVANIDRLQRGDLHTLAREHPEQPFL